MKERALKIANDLYTQHIPVDEIAFTIRRLVEELDKQTYKADLLENRLKVIVGSKPLSDEEILKMASDMFHYSEYRLVIEFARAIEKEHGIK